MRILKKLKTNVAKFAILGIAAFAVVGTTATCIPKHVHAAETRSKYSTYSQTDVFTSTEIVPKGEIMKLISDAELNGSLISKSDNSFVVDMDGTTFRCSYEDAGTYYLHELENQYDSKFNYIFDSEKKAAQFINDLQVKDAKIIPRKYKAQRWIVEGNIPLVKISYVALVKEYKKVNSGVGTMFYECPLCGAHDYTKISTGENDFRCNVCGVTF